MVKERVWVRRLVATGEARQLRKAAGLSASAVARELGVSPAAVSRWERGERNPRDLSAEKWAALLKSLTGESAS